MKKIIKQNWFTILAGIMLLLAIPAIWPYGYFQILRWVVTIVALFTVYLAYKAKKNEWVVVMIIIAILFNPIAPIFLQKQTWVIFDFITSIIMFVSINKIEK